MSHVAREDVELEVRCDLRRSSWRRAGLHARSVRPAVPELDPRQRAVLDPDGVLATRGDEADPYAAEVERRAGEVTPEARAQVRAHRDRLRENGRPLESYRRLTVDRALASLAATAAVDSSEQNR